MGGSSADYVHEILQIPIAFGVELRDNGEFGTNLPEQEILPNAQESLSAILKLGDVIAEDVLYDKYCET